MNINIERARPEDAEVICDIRDCCWLKTYPNKKLGISRENILLNAKGKDNVFVPRRIAGFKDQFAKHDNETIVTLVAKLNGKVVGFIEPRTDEYNKRYVSSLYIDPRFQDKGIGSKLLKRLLELYGQEENIYLEVVSYNEKAINFYKKFGFEKTNAKISKEKGRPDYMTSLPQIEMVLKAKTKS